MTEGDFVKTQDSSGRRLKNDAGQQFWDLVIDRSPDDVPVPASNHFIPMERPDLVADEIGRLARSLGLPA